MKRKEQCWLEASFTVEAAWLMPLIIACLMLVLSLSIGLYRSVDSSVNAYETIKQLDMVSVFRDIAGGSRLLSDLIP